WEGISSYGGFVGGGIGFAIYVWWKRLPARLFADVTIVGLLPAFTIGRIACTMVSDHVGAAVDPNAWYSFLAIDYPREAAFETLKDPSTGKSLTHIINSPLADLFNARPGVDHVLAWNLGLIEFLYLAPICALILYLAFRPSKRPPAAFLPLLPPPPFPPLRF